MLRCSVLKESFQPRRRKMKQAIVCFQRFKHSLRRRSVAGIDSHMKPPSIGGWKGWRCFTGTYTGVRGNVSLMGILLAPFGAKVGVVRRHTQSATTPKMMKWLLLKMEICHAPRFWGHSQQASREFVHDECGIALADKIAPQRLRKPRIRVAGFRTPE